MKHRLVYVGLTGGLIYALLWGALLMFQNNTFLAQDEPPPPEVTVEAPEGENGEEEEPSLTPGEPHPLTGTTFVPERRDTTDELVEQLQLPDGFEIHIVRRELENIRMMVFAPDGTLFISRREQGDVIAFQFDEVEGVAGDYTTVASDLPYAHGLTVYEGRLYIVTDTDLYAADLLGDGEIGELEHLLDDLPDAGQHPNRTIAFGPDQMMYISIGSTCNSCPETNEESATLLRAPIDATEREIFAEGLRNTIGFGWHPETGELWGLDMGSDWRGEDSPPEELNRIEEGNHYGWPFCYGDHQVDVHLPMEHQDTTKEDFCPTTTGPVLQYQAHSSPIAMTFYTGEQFPEAYRNGIFTAMRGSWNRYPPVGYKVAFIPFEDGQPVGFENFVTDFLTEEGRAHFGRIAGIAMAPDGSLFLTEDTNGVLYRITYTGN